MKTVALERWLSNGPADSRLERRLFYLADGLIVGAVLYYGVSLVLFAVSGLDLRMLAIFFILFTVGSLPGWAWLWSAWSRANSSENASSQSSTEWTEIRRWRWVAVLAVPVATLLVSVTVFRWGWEFGWFLPESNLLMAGTLGVGLILRILLRYTVTREG